MIDLLLNEITPPGPVIVPVGKQAVFTITNNILPNNTFGFAYTKGSNTGYVVGGRTNSTRSSRIIKVDLTSNLLSVDYDLPSDITVDTISSVMVDGVIYSYASFAFFKYDTVTKTLTRYPDFTNTAFVATPGQMEGSYNGKIYKCNRVGTNNFNILEYNTLTNTHSIFKNVTVTNIGLFVSSIIVGNMLYVSDPQMGRNIYQVNLDTKVGTVLPLSAALNGTSTTLAVGGNRLYVFSDTTPVVSISLVTPSESKVETSLINPRSMTGIFTKNGYMRSYMGTKANVNDVLIYGLGE